MAYSLTTVTKAIICLFLLWVITSHGRRYLARRRLEKENGCQNLPSTRRLEFFFGLDLLIQFVRWFQTKSPLPDLAEQIKRHGYTFRTGVHGKSRIWTIDPVNIRAAWSSTAFGVAPGRVFPMSPLCGAASLTTDGAVWEHSRSLMRPIFGRAQFADLDAFERHVQNMLALIPRDGSTVDMQQLLARMELDGSTEFIFGESVESLTNNSVDGERFRVSFVEVQRGMARRFDMPLQYDILHRDPDFWRGCRGVHEFVDNAIQKAIARRNNPSTKPAPRKMIMVDSLLSKTSDLIEIRNQLVNAFLPALDSTAVAMSNIIFLLARSPAVYQTLRAEIQQTLGQRPKIDLEMLSPARLPYLHAVINESLRLHPPIASMAREALVDTVLPVGGGPNHDAPFLVRQGETLRASFQHANRRPDIFGSDVNEFRPERWEKLKVDKWEFMPFSGGLRSCLGQQLAMMETVYLMIRLTNEFERIENRDEVWEYQNAFRMVTESARGVKVGLIPAK